MSTKQNYSVTVVVDGVTIGTFDSMGEVDIIAPTAKHRPGGMGPEKEYATLPTYSDIDVVRVYERERDHELARTLQTKAGRVPWSVTEQPLDSSGNAWGRPNVYTGKFYGVKRGDIDSNSGDPRMLTLSGSVTTVA